MLIYKMMFSSPEKKSDLQFIFHTSVTNKIAQLISLLVSQPTNLQC